ncbi:cyclic peptide export ABC transporter [Alteromonas sp. a30]|uniref:cyclic peptide export ABC transporter n=1 Tax=Alteromonas sp. a30 TaxID=2730917 RepID=UPI00227FF14F|nr:cyclic peptide export ABC transporter [Alteromonas sp. a30]MCY7297353.1 cyclic peptide export ABC transporter [Alteromonas sp. a30]
MIRTLLAQNGWLILLATLVSSTSALFALYMVAAISDQISQTAGDPSSWLARFLLGIVALFALGFLSQWLLTLLSTRFVAKLRKTISTNILNANYAQLEYTGGHKLYAALTSDISSVSGALSTFPVFVFNLTAIFVCLLYLATQSLDLFTLLIGVLLVAVGTIQILMDASAVRIQALRESEDSLFSYFKALIDGSKELSVNRDRKRFFLDEQLHGGVQTMKGKERSAQLFMNISMNWGTTVLFIAMGIVAISASVFFQLPQPVVTTFVFVLIYLAGPIGGVINDQQVLIRGFVGAAKLDSLRLNAQPLVETNAAANALLHEPSVAHKKLHDFERLQVRGLHYRYKDLEKLESEDANTDEYHFSVGPIDFEIQRGEVVFFVGGNGSGKSTVAKLITGLYQYDSGELMLNGKAQTPEDDAYRAHFYTIHAECYVFDTLLDEHGKLADDARSREWLERLGLAHKIRVENGVLSSTNLSSGQRKRLALLQAYLQDAPIYVFDEWAAEQDPIFRELFYTELLPELKRQNKAVIAVSHDDAYFGVADRVVKFDQGQIVSQELGTTVSAVSTSTSNTSHSQSPALAELEVKR